MVEELRFFMVDFLKEKFGSNNIIGIEIGVEGGTLSSYLLKHCSNITKLYCIDPWKHFPNSKFDGSKPQESHDYHYKRFLQLTEPYKDRCVVLKMISDEAIYYIKEKVDFIFIDGEHSYDFILRDIINYLPLLKTGGWIGGHDYSTSSVKKAVDEICPNRIIEESNTWWVKNE